MKQTLRLIALLVLFSGCAKPDSAKQNESIATDTAPPTIDKIIGVANIEPINRILPLAPASGGIVSRIYVAIGKQVKKGELLIQLDDAVEQAQLKQALSKVQTQEALIVARKANLAPVHTQFENAKINASRNRKLFDGNALTEKELDDSRFNEENLYAQLQAAEKEIPQQEKRLEELKTDIYYYQTLIAQKKVFAPSAGTVLSVEVKEGSFVNTGTVVSEFAPEGKLMAIIEIDELYADKIQIGQTGYLRPQGGTEILAKGKVILTAPYLRKKSLFSDRADNLEDRRVREVRLELEEGAKVLIGSRVECVIAL